MSEQRFAKALGFALRWEGGFSDHPNDAGGRTMKGVTQRTYDAWLAKQGRAHRDVRDIPNEDVEAIYEEGYWRTARCPDLRADLDVVQFDTAVNMGPNRSVRMLQAAVGVPVDGGFGPVTKGACDDCHPPDAIARYCDIREGFYRKLAARPGQHVFLKGWMNRLNDLRGYVGVPGFAAMRGMPAEATARISDLGPDDQLEPWE